jgi:hypothetical protein
MSETPVVQETTVTPEPPKEFVFKYQPVDPANGQAIGGEQVVKYDGTPEDLGKKMGENNSRLIVLNRSLNKKVRLSSSFKDEIPPEAQRFDPSKYELKPEPLTAEEKIQLAQDMTDPEKMDAVADRLVRARIGDPEILRTRLARVEQRMDRSNVDAEARAFLRLRPDYYPLQANLETLAAWIEKNQLDPIKENFVLAYDTLKDVLEPRPAAPVSVQPPPAPVVETPVQPATPATIRPVSSGLTRSVASDSGPVANPGDEIVWGNFKGYEALERMPGDEYKKKLLHEKGFKEKVQALDNARQQKRAQ